MKGKKPDLSVILGIGEPKAFPKPKMKEEKETEYPEGFEDAAESAFDSFRAEDSKGFCKSLYEAIKAVAEYEETESPEDEAGEPEHYSEEE